MTVDMGILVILMTTAIIDYGPKMLLLQQVTAGASFRGFELSGVPTRRATRPAEGSAFVVNNGSAGVSHKRDRGDGYGRAHRGISRR